ncbi:NAD(P)/FAD-dependent oxidoreductase [Sporolactobacillus shoreicorticis]|uniref:Ferredoxin--NADP reductase n=1 Tax=Sporolactobacillus shoreicorticis TaxID=1923877 RepID=A0ABW5S6S9_9BACL|nr:NAD(P)/FAD-dependent oxidoreductase [Sporolactobacillus shoreicorticis]MCO7125575.1 NAD(P)/FAD-dependent oxidoreductase [Sporolactobacillus shoreicorticis]
MIDLYDVTIIGGGPAGLYTAFYSGMRALKTKLIEARNDLGGVVTHFYPEKTIYDLGGIPGIKGEALIDQLQTQAETFQPKIIKNQAIADMERRADGTFKLISTNGDLHYTRRIILAVGSGTFEVNRLQLEEAREYEGTSLFYAVRRIQQFSGKNVVISGGGNGALDWAAELAPLCKRVTVVYRGERFTHALEHNLERMNQYGVQVNYASEVTGLSGENGQLRNVTVRDAGDHLQQIKADALIVNHGFQCGLGALEQWGMALETETNGILVDQRMETSIKGIFAIGNAASYPQKLYLIAAGFVEGPIAVNSVKHDLDPDAPSQAMVSTHHHFFTEMI